MALASIARAACRLSFRVSVARAVTLAALATTAAGCAATPTQAGSESTDATNDAVKSKKKQHAATLARALAELDRQMDAYSPYYDDSPDGRRQNGARISGCWANPAGSDLTDMQKAFYCAMPLEFRICNTVVLLATKATKDVDARYAGYLKCKDEVASVLDDASFDYSSDVDQAYRKVFLEQDPTWSSEAVIAAQRPGPGDDFPTLLGRIVESLVQEGADLGNDRVTAWADEVQANGGA